jgi:Glu-tRNA(Gln) amidotransferase subunit E-like FAD-binding protein
MKEYLEKIVSNGKKEDMDCLGEILIDSLYNLKENDYSKFAKYKAKIKGMAYNYQLDRELAQEIVEDMKPLGEYWNIETVSSVIGNTPHKLENMYVVMNSLANDYKDVINLDDAETYVKMANAWLSDVDGRENKVWWYFVK